MTSELQKHYRLEVSNHFTAIFIAVNGIGLFNDHFNKAMKKEMGINQYVNTGINSVSIRLWIPPNMESLPNSLDCSVVIAEYFGSEGVFEKKVLKQIDWVWNAETVFPVQLEGSFIVDEDFPRWTWLDAESISGEALDTNSLFKYISGFHQSMVEKDYSKLAALLKTKSTELSNALYINESKYFAEETEFFQDIFSDPAFEMRPVDWDGLIIRYHAENRLIEVVDRKGNPPISSTAFRDDAAFGIELFLAFKNGQWILCR